MILIAESPSRRTEYRRYLGNAGSVIRLGVLYFVQRIPHELNSFRWRIDQKNARRTEYEKAFETIAPGLLQSISLEEPMMMLNGADYSAFKRFEYAKGEAPDHLMTTYGIDIDVSDSTNIGKLVHEDLKFVDSEKEAGVQVADLLASGMRRVSGWASTITLGSRVSWEPCWLVEKCSLHPYNYWRLLERTVQRPEKLQVWFAI